MDNLFKKLELCKTASFGNGSFPCSRSRTIWNVDFSSCRNSFCGNATIEYRLLCCGKLFGINS
jgi:hypothetical protein